jgi:hypothetical protein
MNLGNVVKSQFALGLFIAALAAAAAIFLALPASGSAGYVDEPSACAIWQPDVGDAAQNGLIAVEHGTPGIVGIMPDGTVVEVPLYLGDDFYQVPPELRQPGVVFRVLGCDQTFTAESLGLLGQ